MEIALVCIAKDEDHYIDEWLKYHFKLGFTRAFVYQNNWRYKGDKSQYENVEWIEFDGEYMQMKAYNDFIDNMSNGIDFAGFFDVDEFLCLKKDADAQQFFSRYSDYYAFCVNWRLFGDNGLKNVIDDNWSVVERFTRCQDKMNKHIKTFLNINRCKNMFHFVNPHYVDASLQYDIVVDSTKDHFVHGPFNENASNEVAQLNHYNIKTFEEYQMKMARGRADCTPDHPLYHYSLQLFNEHNFNDVEDMTALKFMRQ